MSYCLFSKDLPMLILAECQIDLELNLNSCTIKNK